MKIFKNRQSAGKILAKRLRNFKADLVLGIPRGGVVVAAEIAKDLNLPLDIVVTRKIGAPGQEELAVGALDPDGKVVWDEQLMRDLGFMIYDLREQVKNALEEIQRREKVYRQGRKPLDISGKIVILVDDGIATGSTVLSAVKYLKRHGAKVILAVPVASGGALKKVKNECEQIIALQVPEYFGAVGQFYQQFEAVSDEEVIQYLK